jgi:hypothetical protein
MSVMTNGPLLHVKTSAVLMLLRILVVFEAVGQVVIDYLPWYFEIIVLVAFGRHCCCCCLMSQSGNSTRARWKSKNMGTGYYVSNVLPET